MIFHTSVGLKGLGCQYGHFRWTHALRFGFYLCGHEALFHIRSSRQFSALPLLPLDSRRARYIYQQLIRSIQGKWAPFGNRAAVLSGSILAVEKRVSTA